MQPCRVAEERQMIFQRPDGVRARRASHDVCLTAGRMAGASATAFSEARSAWIVSGCAELYDKPSIARGRLEGRLHPSRGDGRWQCGRAGAVRMDRGARARQKKSAPAINHCNYNQLRLALRAPCDGHHEMSDLGAGGELVHGAAESVAAAWPQQRRMVQTGLMEMTMSKTTRNGSWMIQSSCRTRSLRMSREGHSQ